MQEVVARRVMDELTANGYTPRFHELEDTDDAFSVSLDGEDFDIDDFKTSSGSARISASASRLDDRGRITLT